MKKHRNEKKMHIIRYADDFRIFCRTKEDAVRTKEAVTEWIEERLKLEVSPEKTRIVNTRKTVVRVSWIQNKGKVEAS